MKKTERTNHRIVIRIEQPTIFKFEGDRDKVAYRRFSEYESRIRKLLNGAEIDFEGVDYEFDVSTTCSRCGSEWESCFDDADGPVCCNKAIEEFEAHKKKEPNENH